MRTINPLGTLPAKATRMWESVYASAQSRGFAKDASAAQAWCAVKRHYYKQGNKWRKRKQSLGQDEQPPGCTPVRARGARARKWKDALPGGLADKKTPKDFGPKALAKGIEVELEHTSDIDLATEIAMDHLTEDPKYYTKLAKMERGRQRNGHERQQNGIGTFIGGMVVGAVGVLGTQYAMNRKSGESGNLTYNIETMGDRSYSVDVDGPDGKNVTVRIFNLPVERATPFDAERVFLKWLSKNADKFQDAMSKGNRILEIDTRIENPHAPTARALKARLLR